MSHEHWCPNCGAPLTAWACSIDHAIRRHEAGLSWDGRRPEDGWKPSDFESRWADELMEEE